MNGDAIRLDQVSLPGARGVLAHGLSLTLARGAALCLAGGSGTGKTRLLRALALHTTPPAGRLHVLGLAAARATARARSLMRQRVGLITPGHGLIPHLSLRDNIALPLLLAGEGEAQSRAQAAELLGWAGLAGRGPEIAASLPVSEQHLALVLRALAARPALILADDPASFLPAHLLGWVLRVLAALQADGTAVLLAATAPPAAWPAEVISLDAPPNDTRGIGPYADGAYG